MNIGNYIDITWIKLVKFLGIILTYLLLKYLTKIIFKRDIRRNQIKTFIVMLVLTILTIVLITNSNIALASIVVTIGLFILKDFYNEYEKLERQEGILRQLYIHLDHIKGNADFFLKSSTPSGWPHHPIADINLHYYLTQLEPSINLKHTDELKKTLMLINDKIIMLNSYRQTQETWHQIKKEMVNEKPYLELVINELKGHIIDKNNSIINEFKIKIHKEDMVVRIWKKIKITK